MAVPSVLPHDDLGAGDPLVLVHGFPLDRSLWKSQGGALSASNRVIAVDLPGFGEATGRPASDSLEVLSEELYGTLEQLASPPVVLVGHSMGGYLALQFACDHPDRLRALVLVSTRSAADTDEAVARRLDTIARLHNEGPGSYAVETARNLLAPANAANPDMFGPVLRAVRQVPVSTLVPMLRALAGRPDYTETLAAIHVPTLVIWGDADRVIPAEETKKLVEAIPGAKGGAIPGTGHLSFLENPAAFNGALAAFVRGLPPAPKAGTGGKG